MTGFASRRADIASTSSQFLGFETRTLIAVIAGTVLCWLALRDPRLRRAPRLLSAGIVLGLLIIAGWIVTTCVVDEFAGPAKPQSLTFVSTVGKALYAGLQNVTNFADFGVGSVFGVVAGSWLAAWRAAELRWEAFDDDHEMRRHLAGGVLMGMGGILAGGCTIGQGLAAGSMLRLRAIPCRVLVMTPVLSRATPRMRTSASESKNRSSSRAARKRVWMLGDHRW